MPHSVDNSTSTQTKMSPPWTASTYSFPKQAGSTLLSPSAVEDQLSLLPSQFSFTSRPDSVQEADQDGLTQLGPIPRGTTFDKTGHMRPLVSRSRHQFYDDSFLYKDGAVSSAHERVTKDAPIVIELRTNVIIKDEYTLITDLSHHLSTCYQSPETSIMITVNHSMCLLLGGSFEPTYILTINALAVQLQPTTNKRNAARIQTHMAESIGVSPDRGIIKFLPIPEENLAINGRTILGEVERLERQYAEQTSSSLKCAIINSWERRTVFRTKSSIQLPRNGSKASPGARTITIPPTPSDEPLYSGVAVNEKVMNGSTCFCPVDGKRTSKKSEPLRSKFMEMFHSNAHLAPPPVPSMSGQ